MQRGRDRTRNDALELYAISSSTHLSDDSPPTLRSATPQLFDSLRSSANVSNRPQLFALQGSYAEIAALREDPPTCPLDS